MNARVRVKCQDTGGWQGSKHAAISQLLFFSFLPLFQSSSVLSFFCLSHFIYLLILSAFVSQPLLQQQGMTIKCGGHSYIMGAGR